MAQPEGVTPSHEDLLAELQALKLANPDMGVKKLQAAVKEKNPTWLVSEARVKKVAIEAGLLGSLPEKPAADAAAAADSGAAASAPAKAAAKKPVKAKAQTTPEPTVPIAEVYPTGDWPVGQIME
jgi:peptidoglycan hydrolase CwlO-like protein